MILKFFEKNWEETPLSDEEIKDVSDAICKYHSQFHRMPNNVLVTLPQGEAMFESVNVTCTFKWEYCEVVYRRTDSFIHIVTP